MEQQTSAVMSPRATAAACFDELATQACLLATLAGLLRDVAADCPDRSDEDGQGALLSRLASNLFTTVSDMFQAVEKGRTAYLPPPAK